MEKSNNLCMDSNEGVHMGFHRLLVLTSVAINKWLYMYVYMNKKKSNVEAP